MDAGIYTLPLFIPFFIQPVQFLPERTPGTRDHDGRFHAICQFDRLYYIYIFQLFWLCHWLFGCIMRKMKNLRHGRYRPNCLQTKLGLLYVYVFPYPCFFPQCQILSKGGGGREGLTGIARYGVLRVIGLLGKRMLRRVATMVEIASSREILPGPGGKKENSRQTSFSPLALSAKRTPTPTTCLAVTNNSSFQKCLHQDTQNHGAGTTAKRRIRKGVDADARPGVGAGRTGGLTCPCLRR